MKTLFPLYPLSRTPQNPAPRFLKSVDRGKGIIDDAGEDVPWNSNPRKSSRLNNQENLPGILRTALLTFPI